MLRCPCSCPILVTVCARVRNFERFSHGRRNYAERVASNVYVGNCLLDFRHVTGDTVATRAAGFVMGVFFDGACVGAIWRTRAMAFQAQNVCGFNQIGIVFRAVNVMTTKAFHTPRVHQAGDKIISLHSILVRGSIGKMCKCQVTQFVIFKLPKVFQILADIESHRPIVILPLNRVL